MLKLFSQGLLAPLRNPSKEALRLPCLWSRSDKAKQAIDKLPNKAEIKGLPPCRGSPEQCRVFRCHKPLLHRSGRCLRPRRKSSRKASSVLLGPPLCVGLG